MTRRLALQVGLALFMLGRAAVAEPERSVTVLYFDNDTGDASYDVLGKGLADMMITDLSTVPGLRVVEREKLEALLAELKLQRTKYFDAATAQKIGRGIGAEYAVAGSVAAMAPDIRIDTRVIHIATGRVVKANKVTGKRDKFFDLQQQLVVELVSGLVPALSAAEAGRVRKAVVDNHAADVGAAVTYGKGLDLRDRGELQSASAELAKLADDDAGFALGRKRYREVLEELHKAKSTRSSALADADARLLRHLDARLKSIYDKGWTPDKTSQPDYALWPYRILRGNLLLKRYADSLTQSPKEYLPHLRAYIDNQRRMLDELAAYHKKIGAFRPAGDACNQFPCFHTDGATEAARDLGLEPPWTVGEHDLEANQVAQDLSALLLFGHPPHYGKIRFRKHICLFKLDPAFIKLSLGLLDEGIAALEPKRRDLDRRWAESEIINLHQQYAISYLQVGKKDEALAKLTTVLQRFPKAKEFQSTEDMVKAILAGSATLPGGAPLVPRCDDP